jgi:YkoP domain
MDPRWDEKVDHPWLAGFIFPIDSQLRRHHSVFEFTNNPRCIFRMQARCLDQPFVLSDGTRYRPGQRMLDLHLWNEQIPCLQSSSLGWALKMSECLHISLAELTCYLRQHGEFKDIAVIRANMSFGTAQQSAQLVRIANRYGFEPIPDLGPHSVRQRIHQFGENILISLMVLSRNGIALRRDSLWRDRTQTFLSRDVLERRYGDDSGGGITHARDG